MSIVMFIVGSFFSVVSAVTKDPTWTILGNTWIVGALVVMEIHSLKSHLRLEMTFLKELL